MDECLPYFVPEEGYPGSPCYVETETNPELLRKWSEICLTCGRTDRSPKLKPWWLRFWDSPKAIESSTLTN
jgi:hypothetical protein